MSGIFGMGGSGVTPQQAKRAARAFAHDAAATAKVPMIPVFANRAPWNELVLRGKRQVKTLGFNWSYRGPILLYTSSNRVDEWGLIDYKVRGLKMEDIPKGVIVGYATVVDVVPESLFQPYDLDGKNSQYSKLFARDPNLLDTLGQSHVVIIENPKRFRSPIPYTPPQGAVRISKAPASYLRRPTI
jgi:hypothetical protein